MTELDLNPISQQLDEIVVGFEARAADGKQPAGPSAIEADLQTTGSNLFTLAVPRPVDMDLRPQKLFLDIGVDERLVGYPWELMYDGDTYLCLKHYVGRFVNVTNAVAEPSSQATNWVGTPLEELRVLLISVPAPTPRKQVEYRQLEGAVGEGKQIVDTLTGLENVRVDTLRNEEAVYKDVAKALSSGKYHIIHYIGHATMTELVLYDVDMTSAALEKFVAKGRPILCFINGCESGKTTNWVARYDIFDLARAFLESGAYLVGKPVEAGRQGGSDVRTRVLRVVPPRSRADRESDPACQTGRIPRITARPCLGFVRFLRRPARAIPQPIALSACRKWERSRGLPLECLPSKIKRVLKVIRWRSEPPMAVRSRPG